MDFNWKIKELKKYRNKYHNLDIAVENMIKDGIIESFNDIGPMTLEEIGYVLKVTRERVRQIEFNAMKKIRRNIIKDSNLRDIFIDL